MFLQSVISSLKQSKTAILLPVFLILLALPITLAAVQTATVTRQSASVTLDSIRNGFTGLYQTSQKISATITGVGSRVSACPIAVEQTVDLLSSFGVASSKSYVANKQVQTLAGDIASYKNYLTPSHYNTLNLLVASISKNFAQITNDTGEVENALNEGNMNNSLYQRNCIAPAIASKIKISERQTLSALGDINLDITKALTALVQ